MRSNWGRSAQLPQEAFSACYREINKDDESAFTAKLMPSIGKLGFDVDFYGRGHFPPGAYHSEGHQDGMGLCLYLALMSHLLGKGFTIAVLDDVLMSVDKGQSRTLRLFILRSYLGSSSFSRPASSPLHYGSGRAAEMFGFRSRPAAGAAGSPPGSSRAEGTGVPRNFDS
jgi:hypothetical protein